MNSINWGRVLAQIPYYVDAGRRLPGATWSVPSGNFGNVLAGWYARRMGAAIGRLVIATNRNDILTRWVRTGDLDAQEVMPTLSPSMDIQVSSNHERLLFELLDRDGPRTAELVEPLPRPRVRRSAALGRFPRGPRRRRRDAGGDRRRVARPRVPGRPAHGGRAPGRDGELGLVRRRRFRSCASRPPTRPSSRMRWSGRPGCGPRCPSGWPICWSCPSGSRSCRTTWRRCEHHIVALSAGAS